MLTPPLNAHHFSGHLSSFIRLYPSQKLVQSSNRTVYLIQGKIAHSYVTKTSFKPLPNFSPINLLPLGCQCGELGIACHMVHDDTVTEKHVTERPIELEPEVAASYVLLDNSHTDVEKYMPAKRIKDLMKDGRITMKPGLSWIEVGKHGLSYFGG